VKSEILDWFVSKRVVCDDFFSVYDLCNEKKDLVPNSTTYRKVYKLVGYGYLEHKTFSTSRGFVMKFRKKTKVEVS
jgi:hypothetical protein